MKTMKERLVISLNHAMHRSHIDRTPYVTKEEVAHLLYASYKHRYKDAHVSPAACFDDAYDIYLDMVVRDLVFNGKTPCMEIDQYEHTIKESEHREILNWFRY